MARNKNGERPQFYLGKKNLRNADHEMELTPEQQKEFVKCAHDPLYFFENYIHIISLNDGKVKFKPYPFQKKMVKTCVDNRFVLVKLPRQSGKCVSLNTIVKVRNKKTGHIEEITIGKLYEKAHKQQAEDVSPLPDDIL